MPTRFFTAYGLIRTDHHVDLTRCVQLQVVEFEKNWSLNLHLDIHSLFGPLRFCPNKATRYVTAQPINGDWNRAAQHIDDCSYQYKYVHSQIDGLSVVFVGCWAGIHFSAVIDPLALLWVRSPSTCQAHNSYYLYYRI